MNDRLTGILGAALLGSLFSEEQQVEMARRAAGIRSRLAAAERLSNLLARTLPHLRSVKTRPLRNDILAALEAFDQTAHPMSATADSPQPSAEKPAV